MNIEIERINNQIKDNHSEFIQSVNHIYLNHLANTANEIALNRNERPVILLAGPSGSGKTTTSLMIEKLLDNMGIETHSFSMDNYFRPLSDEEQLLAANGKIDLESPDRMDIDLLNTQIEAIMRYEPIKLPRYNFITSSREYTGEIFRRKPNELVIFEGIHALNPAVITVPNEKISNIYVSVRTRVTCSDFVLHPSKIRLMRRMVRDKNFRKRSLKDTIKMFKSVENGENKYIAPYKYRSNYDIDTFIAYEINTYRNILLDELKTITDEPDIIDIIRILESSVPIEQNIITPDSLICEFIGNGQFSY